MAIAPEDFLQEDYKQKIGYLTAHFTRMWARFNYFVAIETALVGGKFLIPIKVPERVLSITGVLISAVWFVMGSEDRYLVRLYRDQVKQVAEQLAKLVWPDEKMRKAYRYVGQVDEAAQADLYRAENSDDAGKQQSWIRRFFGFKWLNGWRWDPISTTTLAELFPLLVLILWLIVLVATW